MAKANLAIYDTIEQAKAILDRQEAKHASKAGWLMVTALLIESWDIYSMSFIMTHLKDVFHPSAALLGFTSAGTQLGAIVGAILGGWLTDKYGRRNIFMASMTMFAICAVAQGLAPSMAALAVIRCIAGIPVGADVANGFTYMMEIMPKGKREVMANRWQFMFSLGILCAIALVTAFELGSLSPNITWRIILAIPAIPAVLLLLARHNLPETPTWYVEHGRFVEARKVAADYYGKDVLAGVVPDENMTLPRPTWGETVKDLFSDEFTRRSTIFAWISNFVQALENYSFSFYLPTILAGLGIATLVQNNLAMFVVYILASISAFVGPMLLPKIGHKGLSQWGFGLVAVGIVISVIGIANNQMFIIILGSGIMLWGHYWSSESGQTVASLVAKPAYRGAASGIAYTFVKLASFVTLWVFPVLFEQLGVVKADLIVVIFPIIAFLAATFILPEVFNHAVSADTIKKEGAAESK
ncbi:MFS transporter [Bifidobacterium panos]|uniref:MFS transporter n=1 Tax=Bifidobacterium panos TaxID=2675321 RepID=A0ABX1SY21_9BIFI|nr:MFS transporter [Bifidobacterium sp. DSM 109963]NMN01661.1 MFS transporter [Bifidobacterium sp. DSM 109963]